MKYLHHSALKNEESLIYFVKAQFLSTNLLKLNNSIEFIYSFFTLLYMLLISILD